MNKIMNTPIKELLKDYEMDHVADDRLESMAYRYIDTMGDSQVRCILYILLQKFIEGK